MAALTQQVKATDIARDMTLDIEITGLSVWRVRVWIGMRLIALAAKVMGCSIVTEQRP
jgi:hypothetical protein